MNLNESRRARRFTATVNWLRLSAVVAVTGCASVALAAPSPGTPAEVAPSGQTNSPSTFRSPEDGWLDMSNFLDKAYGFVPVVIPITEPAVGYGAAGGLAFIDKPEGTEVAGFGRPNLTAVGGMATENGSWGAMVGDVRHWQEDRLQTLIGVAYASINLDYYGIGDSGPVTGNLSEDPLGYNLKPLGGLVQAKYRLGNSRWWGGMGYALASTEVKFDVPTTTIGLPDFERESRVGGLMPMLTFDSRDNIFTPGRGTYFDSTVGCFSEALGGDDEFQRVNLLGMHYLPLHSKWTLGLRADANLSFGEVPFYLRPYIHMRGVAAMRYQGEHVAQTEAELRWQCWKRFSLVGFVGTGVAWNDFERFEQTQSLVAGGTGFRYELARKYGLHMGLDVAFGPDDPAVYVQFGSAWMRP